MAWLGPYKTKVIRTEEDLMLHQGLKSVTVVPAAVVEVQKPVMVSLPITPEPVPMAAELVTAREPPVMATSDVISESEVFVEETFEAAVDLEPITDPAPEVIGSDPPVGSVTIDLNGKTKSELIAIATELGIDNSGTKAELFKRLNEHQNG